jgi:hypothetical protein
VSDTSNLLPSLVRTFIPLVVGVLSSLGFDSDEQNTSVLVTAGAAFLFYAVVRFLEVYAGPKWGYILGIAKSPGYASHTPAAAPVGRHSRPDGDLGAISLGLIATVVVVVLAVLFVVSRV